MKTNFTESSLIGHCLNKTSLSKNGLKEKEIIKKELFKKCVGYSRHECLQALSTQGIESIMFAHWLAIPSQQLLLIFRHQQCIAIDYYQLAA